MDRIEQPIMQAIYAALLGVSIAGTPPEPTPAPPEPGFCADCDIVEVYDGDTVTVEIVSRVKVRLEDCWAPEIRTKDLAEKQRGVRSRDHLAQWLGLEWPPGAKRWTGRTPARLHVAFDGADDVGDITSLGRVVGRVWPEGCDFDLSSYQISHGHATAEAPDAR